MKPNIHNYQLDDFNHHYTTLLIIEKSFFSVLLVIYIDGDGDDEHVYQFSSSPTKRYCPRW